MPSWQPNWEDVKWDWGAASNAVQALRRSADLMETTARQRMGVAHQAQTEWRGRYRLEFDDKLRYMDQRAYGIASELRALAARIASASEAARAEQSHRESERARWRSEKEEEERREREREREKRRRQHGG